MSEDAITVTINWTKPLAVNDLSKGIPTGGGVYLWLYPEEKAINYMGQTDNFRRRTVEHFATTFGYGGTICSFAPGDDPYNWLSVSNIKEAANQKKIIYRWNDDEYFTEIAQWRSVVEQMEQVWGYMSEARIVFGSVMTPNVRFDEIEGGIILALKNAYDLGSWPGGKSNDTIIGRISKYPVRHYRLLHDGDGKDTMNDLLKDAIHDGIIGPEGSPDPTPA